MRSSISLSFLITIRKIVLFPIALIISFVVTILVFLIVPLLLIFVIPYYYLILLVSKFAIPNAVRILSGSDNVMALGTVYNSSYMYLSITQVFEGRLEYEKVLLEIQKRVLDKKRVDGSKQFPELQYYIKTFLGYSFYIEDKTFDLKNHVRVYESRDEIIDKKKLCKIREEEGIKLFQEKRSPWEIVIINNYRKNDKEYSVLLWKIHHCMGDGAALNQLIFSSFGDFPMLRVPEFGGKITVNLSAYVNYFIQCATLTFDLIYNPLRVFDFNSWHKPIIQKDLKAVLFTPEPVDVDLVKEISSANKISITAVLMTACIGGFRKMMEAKGVETPKTARCWFSYNLPNPRGFDGLTCNSSANHFRVPLSAHRDPIEMSKVINKKMIVALTVGYKIMSKIMQMTCEYIPASYNFKKPAPNLLTTFGFSSFPMPSIDVQMADCKLVENYSCVETPTGMTPYCIKYKNKFYITFAIQRTLLKTEQEIYDLEKYFLEEFKLMKANSLTP